MTRRIPLLLASLGLALALLGTATAARAGGEVARTPEFEERIDEAIERGARWVLDRQLKDGGFGGYQAYPAAQTALAYHTLRVCGVPRADPAMERAYAALRREYVEARDADSLRTYTAAIVMMAIESRWWPQDGRVRDDARYGRPEDARKADLDDRDLAWMRELVAFIEGNQNAAGAWSYGRKVDRYSSSDVRAPNRYDHSNTQYALLGLKAASRSGVSVAPEVYESALEHLLEAQQQDGPQTRRVEFVGRKETFAEETDRARGWGYRSLAGTRDAGRRRGRRPGAGGAYGSMTAGSLGALVICRSELLGWRGYSQRLDARAEQAIWDGIAWLGRHFAVHENPSWQGWHYYYLYALERAGVLAGVDWMGEHDWYGRGAEYLVDRQDRDGQWREAGPPIVSTCFALLFLKRGTKPVPRGAVTPSGGGDDIDFGAAIGLSGKDLEDFVDLVVSRHRRAGGDRRRAALVRGLASVGPDVVLPLLKRMATGDDEERATAHVLATEITGQTFPFDPAAEADARFDQLIAWEEWYMARADRLVYDADSGRLRTR